MLVDCASENKRSVCDVLSIIVALRSAYASASAALLVGLCVFVCSQVRTIQLCECSGGWVCMYFWVSRWIMEDTMQHKRSPQAKNLWQLIGHNYVACHWNQLNISSTRQSRSTVSSVLAPQCQPPVIKACHGQIQEEKITRCCKSAKSAANMQVRKAVYTSSSRASRGRKFPKGKELYSKERICL